MYIYIYIYIYYLVLPAADLPLMRLRLVVQCLPPFRGVGLYRGTSLIRKRFPVVPYSRTVPRALGGSYCLNWFTQPPRFLLCSCGLTLLTFGGGRGLQFWPKRPECGLF